MAEHGFSRKRTPFSISFEKGSINWNKNSMGRFVPDLYPEMVRAVASVLSSKLQGLSIVFVGAQSLGVSIISTEYLSDPRDIFIYGKQGKLVLVDNPFALAAAIASTLTTTLLRPPCGTGNHSNVIG